MSNNIIQVQIAYPAGNKSPIVGGTDNGSMLRSFLNVTRFITGLLTGVKYNMGGAWLQYQTTLVAASATCTPVSPAVNDTVSIAGTALTAKQGRATGTATAASVTAATTLTLNGVVFTAVNGSVTLGDATFDCSGSDSACATSIAAQVNAYASPLLSGLVAARSASAIVTFYAVTAGTAGNSITLASSNGTTLAVSDTTLTNGAALTNNQFDCKGTDVTTGSALAYAINHSTTAAVQRTTATSSSSTGVVTVTAKVAGVAGNAITFTSSSNTTLAVTGSGFLASGSAGEPVRLTL